MELSVELLVGLIGAGLFIGGGIFTYMIKNARCQVRLESAVATQGKDLEAIKKKLGIQDATINELDKKVAILHHETHDH